jgi:hypothetical protein
VVLVGTAGATPQVEIRARTEVVLTRVRLRQDDTIEVTGKLLDKLTGDGLPGQRVEVMLGGESYMVVTAPDGSFRYTAEGAPGMVQVGLQFSGARGLDAADPVEVSVDPSKVQLELSIVKIAEETQGTRLDVQASTDEGPASLPIALEIAGADGQFRRLHDVESETPFVLTRQDAGGTGQFRLRATFAGDSLRQHATAEITLELTAGTTTTLDLATKKLAYESDLVVNGKVSDDDGKPVSRAAVTLTAGDKRLAQGATADDGTYKFRVEAQLLGECPQRPCSFGIQVQADIQSPYLRSSRSEPAVVTVAAPQPVPVSYTVAAFIATALAAGGFFLARTKPWLRLRRKAVPPAEAPRPPDQGEPARGGLVVAKPGMMSTLRRASDDGFSGVVRDTARGRPVGQAVVRLLLGPEMERGGLSPTREVDEREVRSASDGTFALEKLAAGEWRAEVAASGHVTERFAVTIPHRGELRGVRIDLVPVRERVFQLYRRAAEPMLPEARLWGIWSPRQIVDHVRSKRPTPALSDLTDFVEEIYFSPRLAAETVLPQASERVDRAIHERASR